MDDPKILDFRRLEDDWTEQNQIEHFEDIHFE
jgi:hypothetical protein